MSTENFGHRDALHELLNDDDDDFTGAAQPPLTRRQLRELHREDTPETTQEREERPAFVEPSAARQQEQPRTDRDQSAEEKARAEHELMLLLGGDAEDEDDFATPPARTSAPTDEDLKDLFGEDDDEATSSDDRDESTYTRAARVFPARATAQDATENSRWQRPPEGDEPTNQAKSASPEDGIDVEAWINSDDDPDNFVPEPVVPVRASNRKEAKRAPKRYSDDEDVDHGGPATETAGSRREPNRSDDEGPIDLVPETRKLKAGLFAGKQEKQDSREERDAVKRLNELREKISAALVTEQSLAWRISDLQDEAETRQSLADVRKSLETESAQLAEIRNETERLSVRM